MILDVTCCCLSLFLLCVNVEVGGVDVDCWTSRWPPVWEVAVHLAVAGHVFDGVFFLVLSFLLRDVYDEIWILIEAVSEGFLPTLSNVFTCSLYFLSCITYAYARASPCRCVCTCALEYICAKYNTRKHA